jgi:hypothetical protein
VTVGTHTKRDAVSASDAIGAGFWTVRRLRRAIEVASLGFGLVSLESGCACPCPPVLAPASAAPQDDEESCLPQDPSAPAPAAADPAEVVQAAKNLASFLVTLRDSVAFSRDSEPRSLHIAYAYDSPTFVAGALKIELHIREEPADSKTESVCIEDRIITLYYDDLTQRLVGPLAPPTHILSGFSRYQSGTVAAGQPDIRSVLLAGLAHSTSTVRTFKTVIGTSPGPGCPGSTTLREVGFLVSDKTPADTPKVGKPATPAEPSAKKLVCLLQRLACLETEGASEIKTCSAVLPNDACDKDASQK